jgi:alkanesulfonate monooxygenase SsuD/methylene tetrahydromethanopterin reductase-like flavin-dependent oxidoreductase (luciferase family)
MKYGFVIPGGEVRELAEVAHEADEAGWDGVFIPDCIYIDAPGASESLGFDPG